ncbi:MAG: DNA adenine methylase, partial [Pseudomonadota bacterium]
QGVVIENRPAIQVIRDNDGPETLHYVDPPYVHATRGKHTDAYRHEMSDPDHAELLDALCDLKGAVVLSGYSSPLYDEALTGWRRAEIRVRADKALERTEVIWMNFEDEVGLLQALSRKSIS